MQVQVRLEQAEHPHLSMWVQDTERGTRPVLSQEQLSLFGESLTNTIHCCVKMHRLAANARVQHYWEQRAMAMEKIGLVFTAEQLESLLEKQDYVSFSSERAESWKVIAKHGKINESHCCYCRTVFDFILIQELMLMRAVQEIVRR